jgi:hypothetical protein
MTDEEIHARLAKLVAENGRLRTKIIQMSAEKDARIEALMQQLTALRARRARAKVPTPDEDDNRGNR